MPIPGRVVRSSLSLPAVLSVLAVLGLLGAACGSDSPAALDVSAPDSLVLEPASDDRLWPTDPGAGHEHWTVRVVGVVEHDATAFTQGLERGADGIVESTGLRGRSELRLLDATTGAVVRSHRLDDTLFGEGVTVVGSEIIQLTWTAGVALRYDAATFEAIGSHSYVGEGWGLCFDGADLWMSNGSARLTRRDPDTFEPLDEIEVRREGTLVADLNELECTEGRVLANVWKSDEIVVIDPTSGEVQATIDAAPLVDDVDLDDSSAVLNGVADLGDGTLLVGGKLWPRLFVVELVATPAG